MRGPRARFNLAVIRRIENESDENRSLLMRFAFDLNTANRRQVAQVHVVRRRQ